MEACRQLRASVNPNVVWRRETKGGRDKGLLLFNYETQRVHFIKGISEKLWNALAENNEINTEKLAKAINASEQEIFEILKEFEKRRLIIFEHVN